MLLGQDAQHYVVGGVPFQDSFKVRIEVFKDGGRTQTGFKFIEHFIAAQGLFNGCLVCHFLV